MRLNQVQLPVHHMFEANIMLMKPFMLSASTLLARFRNYWDTNSRVLYKTELTKQQRVFGNN